MKITGLITEYNPFHNGHLYHIRKSKEVTGADYCIVLMSGSFVQRGAPAVYDKYTRTSMALSAGADLIIEMPLAFSTSSAMEFAAYGVAMFTALGITESICFGSECGRLEPLAKIASLLAEEPPEFGHSLRTGLKQGLTYPEARKLALLSFLGQEEQEILNSPNNILGIEYIKAGITQQSPLKFYTIRREGQAYHDTAAAPVSGPHDSHRASASAIRHILGNKNFRQDKEEDILRTMVPNSIYSMIRQEIPLFPDDFSSLLNYRILKNDWYDIADLTPELDARIKKSALTPAPFEERIQTLKTKQITYTRVSRALLHLLLDLHETDVQAFKEKGYAPYARILGFRKSSLPLLNKLKRSSSIPFITKLADAAKLLDEPSLSMLRQEIDASHIYQMVRHSKGGAFKNEYTQGVIISDTETEYIP